ncbi:MAG: polysaccharide pyruvyl transferase family protein [Promethearchaeota archaeon]
MKLLLTDLAYFYHNYGAQGILIPFIEKMNEKLDVEITVTVSNPIYFEQDKQFAANHDFEIFLKPRLKFSSFLKLHELQKLREYREMIRKQDVVIDLSGIELIGNLPKIIMWKNLINTLYTQKISERYNKKYYKFTKSYGPFNNKLYTKIISKKLNKLPFLLVRGEQNMRSVSQLKLDIPIYSFPDISLTLKPADAEWAKNYISNLGINKTNIIGISPSVVIRNISNITNMTSGENHVELCKRIILKYCNAHQSILLIPHSIGNGKNLKTCDLALARKIYNEIPNNENLVLLDDINLTYQQTRAIIGQLSFYITSRYHSLASALKMRIPTISLSWHIKYKDIMKLYLDKFLTIDCRKINISDAMKMIDGFYENRDWFSKKLMQKRQSEVENEIRKSIKMIVGDIKKDLL